VDRKIANRDVLPGVSLRLVLVWCALAALGCGAAPEASSRTPARRPLHGKAHALRCGIVWDPQGGAIPDGRIVFDGDRIGAVGPAGRVPAGGEELDLRPLFCMPGLVDAHTHLTSYAHESGTDALDVRREAAAHNAQLTLRAGVTSVRDLGGSEGVDLWLRARIASGAIPGPRMQCAGSQIGAQGSVGGPSAAKAEVAAHAGAGFDVIKLFATGGAHDPVPLLSAPEIAAATAEAHARRLRVAVHAISGEGIDRSIAAGVDSIEHGQELTVEQASAMAARGIALVPTLYILRYYVEDAGRLGFAPEEVDDLRQLIDTLVVPFERRFPAILATGVKVAMGSDAFMALHGRNAREIGYLVRAGMSRERALQAATSVSADLLGWGGTVGALAAGAYADVIAMRGNPLDDAAAVEHVAVVVKGGEVVRDDLGASTGSVRAR
jgi:imidazolonepropionase-like amidohydrolase